jgi:hypothetical protein
MYLENILSVKIKEFFNENFKLLFVTQRIIIIVTKKDKVY